MNKKHTELTQSDVRYEAFQKAIRFVNYELIEGDVLEFGLYTGRSLAMLQIANEEYMKKSIHKLPFSRDFVGFDSFRGLFNAHHPRWQDGDFAVNHSWHPTIKVGEAVTGEKVIAFFKKIGLKEPLLVEGEFKMSLKKFANRYLKKVAIVHIDCDTYESTKTVLKCLPPLLQEGTVLLFDDWFHYRANVNFGEARAFNEFRKRLKTFSFVEYFNYGTFCKAFIVVAK